MVGFNYISDEISKTLVKQADMTPDVPELNLYENHYLFVYGTLKRGCRNHDMIKSQKKTKFCGVGVSSASNFDLCFSALNDIVVAIAIMALAKFACSIFCITSMNFAPIILISRVKDARLPCRRTDMRSKSTSTCSGPSPFPTCFALLIIAHAGISLSSVIAFLMAACSSSNEPAGQSVI